MNWSPELAKTLYVRFVTIWGTRFTHTHTDPKMIDMWVQDWYEGLAGIDLKVFKEALNYCKLNLEWPPSLAAFRKTCERISGIPDAEEAYEFAIGKMFIHPLIEKTLSSINDYDFRLGSNEDNKKRFVKKYNKFLEQERLNKLQLLLGSCQNDVLSITR